MNPRSMLNKAARAILPELAANRIAASVNRRKFPRISPLPRDHERNINLRETFRWFDLAQRVLQVNRVSGVYAEFGSHEGNTFRFALNTLGRYDHAIQISHFYAFDSFEGMPEPEGLDRQTIWRKGMNATSLERFSELCRDDLHRVTVVKGFFEDSLPKMRWPDSHRIALAYIDVDYYTSTRDALNFIADKVQHGSVIGLDDWNCYYADPARGQRKAFAEFRDRVAAYGTFEPFLPISFGGMSFIYQERSKLGTETL